ncbi:hypothetical protein QJQ45_015974 [Haematococcus lacustris]|nr:hypothetical protein QJQ45_015974 [Haematococcus lacustris]
MYHPQQFGTLKQQKLEAVSVSFQDRADHLRMLLRQQVSPGEQAHIALELQVALDLLLPALPAFLLLRLATPVCDSIIQDLAQLMRAAVSQPARPHPPHAAPARAPISHPGPPPSAAGPARPGTLTSGPPGPARPQPSPAPVPAPDHNATHTPEPAPASSSMSVSNSWGQEASQAAADHQAAGVPEQAAGGGVVAKSRARLERERKMQDPVWREKEKARKRANRDRKIAARKAEQAGPPARDQ